MSRFTPLLAGAALSVVLAAPAPGADGKLAPILHRRILQHDPFERPEPPAPPPAATPTGPGTTSEPPQPAAPAWRPTLRGTVVAGPHSVADLDGEIVAQGEEVNGHRLVEVREREAVLESAGTRVVVTMDEH